ncbi:hypothetical protein QBC42DRAFT_333633 [Cladorrhinum samala]|uniref:Uncharacterized protein n=1 Tax=Cladorrhinum samala TaxID=585594 RepID=A0AAV9HK00_9PEZI|nr:hypothetical protein QBC42DRAFT_333633 [Cladorrhinum samala]
MPRRAKMANPPLFWRVKEPPAGFEEVVNLPDESPLKSQIPPLTCRYDANAGTMQYGTGLTERPAERRSRRTEGTHRRLHSESLIAVPFIRNAERRRGPLAPKTCRGVRMDLGLWRQQSYGFTQPTPRLRDEVPDWGQLFVGNASHLPLSLLASEKKIKVRECQTPAPIFRSLRKQGKEPRNAALFAGVALKREVLKRATHTLFTEHDAIKKPPFPPVKQVDPKWQQRETCNIVSKGCSSIMLPPPLCMNLACALSEDEQLRATAGLRTGGEVGLSGHVERLGERPMVKVKKNTGSVCPNCTMADLVGLGVHVAMCRSAVPDPNGSKTILPKVFHFSDS